MKEQIENEAPEMVANPLNEGEKRMAGYSRYAITQSGIIRNIMTGNTIQIDAEKRKYRLTNDEGARTWFLPTVDYLAGIFAPPVIEPTTEDHFTNEILPANSPIIEQTHSIKEVGGVITEAFGFKMDAGTINQPKQGGGIVTFATKAKNTKRDLSDQDIRDLRSGIENKSLTFKTASEKYGIHVEHARRIYKRQYYPNVV